MVCDRRRRFCRSLLALVVFAANAVAGETVFFRLGDAPRHGGLELRFVSSLVPALEDGDGGGAGAVVGVETSQILYDSPEVGEASFFGNTVLVTWTSGEVDTVAVDGPPTLEEGQLFVSGSGESFVFLSGFPRCNPDSEECPTASFESCTDVERANLFEITVIGADDSAETVCQEILPSWPLANDMELSCTPGSDPGERCELNPELLCAESTEGESGCCGIIVGGCNNGPTASSINILVDGELRLALEPKPAGEPEEIKCFRTWLEVPPTGSHQVTALGFLSREKAADTSWTDDSGVSYEAPTGSFLGIDPNVFLDGFAPALVCEVVDGCFSRGRVEESSPSVDLSDGVAVLNFLFLGGSPPECLAAADIDDSGDIALTDAVVLFSFLFIGGTSPPPPFGSCGDDENPDGLGCVVPACS